VDISRFLSELQYQQEDAVRKVRCAVRQRWYVLTPEETVRQCCLRYLISIGYSPKLISVEKQIRVNGLKRRFDILVYTKAGIPKILVECKAPKVSLHQSGLDQVNAYNHVIKVGHVWLTNGHAHVIYARNEDEVFKPVSTIPSV